MIPEFPKFKHLELTDREDVMQYTSKFLPYSDFNFVSMWSWDTEEKIMLSQLNGNLVVKFSDYVTGEPFFSFIGENNVEETISLLIDQAKSEGIIPVLKLVPEEAVKQITSSSALPIKEDRDNFDYVFSTESLATMAGAKLASKRNYIKRFKRDYSFEFCILDFKNKDIQREVLNLSNAWATFKGISNDYLSHEMKAIERYFEMDDYSNHRLWGIRIKGELVAFWAVEILGGGYSISHFQKGMSNLFRGIYPVLYQVGAEALLSENALWINLEQDLGVLSLREGKMDYNPSSYLEKFMAG